MWCCGCCENMAEMGRSGVWLCGVHGVSEEFTVMVLNDNTRFGQFYHWWLYIAQLSFHAENAHPAPLSHLYCCGKRKGRLYCINYKDSERWQRELENMYIQPSQASQVIGVGGGWMRDLSGSHGSYQDIFWHCFHFSVMDSVVSVCLCLTHPPIWRAHYLFKR